MGIQIIGNGGVIAEVDGTTYRALRATSRPVDYGSLGSYGMSLQTGTLAAALAASAVVFSARWSDATRFAVIHRLEFNFQPLTLFTAATLTDATSFDAFQADSFTAAHTGGTAITLTGNALKRRTSMGSTLFNDIRLATTAAIAGGTLTLRAQPFAQSLRKPNAVNPAAATEETIPTTFNNCQWRTLVDSGEGPIVLAQDQGIVIRNRTVWPAAGTGIFLVEMDWSEVSAY